MIYLKDYFVVLINLYKCNSLQDLQKYEISFSKNLREEYNLKFAQSAPTFRTIMEVLDEF